MIYEQFIMSEKNPIINNHSVYGSKLLPGLAYIDIIYQVFRKHFYAHKNLELRNLTIYNPLTVENGHKIKIEINCTKTCENQWNVRIINSNEMLYVTAEMYKVEQIEFKEKIDIDGIKRETKEIIELEEIYKQCRQEEIVHTGIMEAKGKVFQGELGNYIEIFIDENDKKSYEGFIVHPALIDGSAIGSRNLFSSFIDGEDRIFLPLFYESFKTSALLQKACIARILKSSIYRKNELLYATIEFFNDAGEKVSELKNFVCKLVRRSEVLSGLKKNEVKINEKFQYDFTGISSSTFEADESEKSSDNHLNIGKGEHLALLKNLQKFLKQIIALKLQCNETEIELESGYYEMGLDSLMLLEVIKLIEEKLGVKLSPTLLFEYTTIATLTEYLSSNYAESFRKVVASSNLLNKSFESKVLSNKESHTEKNKKLPINNDVAIIGMSGKYPMAKNLKEFWDNLKLGKNCISEIPESRWDYNLYREIKHPTGKPISRWGGFIDDPDCFDSRFFRISPREAEIMDPQERLFLEICWEAIEDSGYTPKNIVTPKGVNKRRHVGVFVGAMHKDYTLIGAEATSYGELLPLSLNYAQIANRVSYFCDFHGPSMVVDTLCSSSLTAIHLALESICHGECEVALAGGVNLSLHPAKYMTYGIIGMHSSDGLCHTFGEGGDGYVSSEGVGVVLLKSLSKAIEDKDNIYAVIKGSAINHGGTVSGITVPSPVAQEEVIKDCLEKTEIDPRTISYIEAHGTGTSLGDPIEIQGLTRAFRLYTNDNQFCSIGSVKSNMGHAESAAGICGLTKVALQLYNKTLVPSIHSKSVNPFINFEQSPFYIQRETEEWRQMVVNEKWSGAIFPRRAGLSSFGATGTNVHIILEEYIKADSSVESDPMIGESVIIPLSAKNKERLHAYVSKLLDFIKEKSDANLKDISYTLMIGRVPMEERVAFIARSTEELINQLESFLRNEDSNEYCFTGNTKQYREVTSLFLEDEDSRNLIYNWVLKGKIQKLAELWVKGVEIEWNVFYSEIKTNRISLPTYPFSKEHHWIRSVCKDTAKLVDGERVVSYIHPLLHENTSDLSKQRFSSTFTGREFLFSDHKVNGKCILPGVAYLEMAREALKLASGLTKNTENIAITLKNVVWLRTIAVEKQPVCVHIGIVPVDNGELSYEIYNNEKESGSIINCKGSAILNKIEKNIFIDINEIKEQCKKNVFSSSQCYNVFKSLGIEYGDAYRGIESLYVGENLVLAKLVLPSCVLDTKDKYILHPSLMDSALQSAIGFMMSGNEYTGSSAMPFALNEIKILSRCTLEMWALIKVNKEISDGKKLNIDLYDEKGMLCVRMTGFSMRAIQEKSNSSNKKKPQPDEERVKPRVGNLVLTPVWDVAKVNRIGKSPNTSEKIIVFQGNKEIGERIKPIYPNAYFVESNFIDEIERILLSNGEINHVIFIPSDSSWKSLIDNSLIEDQDKGVMHLFRLVKLLIGHGYGLKNLGWTVLTKNAQPINKKESVNPTHISIHGLVGSMAKEYPKWNVRLVDLENSIIPIIEKVFTLPYDCRGRSYVYRDGEIYRQQLIKVETTSMDKTIYKEGGIYIVIGGAGGIGEDWTEYMIRNYKAQVIWVGRREKNQTIQGKINRLGKYGPEPQYISADASNANELHQVYVKVKSQYSQINGVIHSAMVLTNASLEVLQEEEFILALSSKIDISVRLAQVFNEEDLDFILFFSSMITFIKNPKQSHYAAGCCFEDVFAHQLSQELNCRVKVMNWGYWHSDKVIGLEEFKQLEQIGLGTINAKDGMETLETLLVSPINQLGLMKITKPLEVEGMNNKEVIIIHSGKVVSDIQKVYRNIPSRDSQIEQIILEERL
ncbi:SDR family NAD(P)-dependent oxidoreductase [Clostridium estertheticum]|uniref:SDR family NAD(P)-dependent oxidoreductase n=1 Tax=Clostridium estertheticum TaxID=238834 RepID=UPI001CF46CC4|nr:SDR family NAD(P)-dependent oxidoreductase [Clostridium estertheticum]MCB2360148.1 SDR family NAD(P)-dependent oxidoreductase [Clostridium estertheticum]